MQISSILMTNINQINSNRKSTNNLVDSNKNLSFGYGISIARKDFKNARKTLKNPKKINKLDQLEKYLLNIRENLIEIVDNVQEKTKAKKEFFPTINLGLKIVKGGDYQVLVSSENKNQQSISNLFDTSGNIQENVRQRLFSAIERKAKDGAEESLKAEYF